MDAFDSCLRNGRLKPIDPDPAKLEKEIKTAISELSRARSCYTGGNYEECVVQSYFSSNRVFRVLLNQAGYRDTNLYSLVAGVDHLLVQTGRVDSALLEILKLAKEQKDLVQEGARCGRKETRLILGGAEEIMEVAREMLDLGEIPELDEPAEGTGAEDADAAGR